MQSLGLLLRRDRLLETCQASPALLPTNRARPFQLTLARQWLAVRSVTDGEQIQLNAAQLNIDEYSSPKIPGYDELQGNQEKNFGCCQCVIPGYHYPPRKTNSPS